MKKEMQKEEILKDAIHQSVSGKEPTVVFEKIWEESQKRQSQPIEGRRKMNKKKIVAVAIIAATLSVTTLSAQYVRRVDNIRYSFQNDKEVLGPWTVVDFVGKEGDFKPGKSHLKGETYMFYQWKAGDYVIRGMEPSYYVLKKQQE